VQAELANPFGGDALERQNQLLDQRSRRYETLIPLERNLTDLQTERTNIASSASEADLKNLDQRISNATAAISLEKQYLSQLDASEQALLRQQQIYAKYGFIADEVSRAFSDSISGIITGTTTVAEAFGRMFENIGKAFIDMATQILAQKLFFTVVNALNPGLGAGTSSAGTALATGKRAISGFAEGGFVTGPTYALIGEGGEPEYVIPFSKMDDAMTNYSNGARGESVLSQRSSNVSNSASSISNSELSRFSNSNSSNVSNAAGDRVSNVSNSFSTLSNTAIPFTKSVDRMMMERSERETVAAINNPKPLDVRFESQVINGVEYVTAEQHQRGMAQAAERGRALTLQALQNSVKTRKQVGMA